ncbi:MAG: hypothetical protein CVU79_05520 [Elusimicrobia bacterium HGW-Elusimicrobia-3]|nr:MAG: hypothetical protein CVU79_05520 [Elusimicrobia bacterium HGW-Elusimicrobia-3]
MKLGLKLFALSLLLAAGPAASQQPDDGDYRKMMEQMMKSGNNSQARAQSWDARLKVISGTVMVKTVDGDEWSRITGEMPLDPNDMVKTSSDGLAEIYLDDKGAISLGRNTELEISSLEQEDAVFSINFGSLVAKIKHFLNEKHRLKVRTPSAVCAVRGTEFAVEYSQLSKEFSAGVFDEGRVAVTQEDDSGGTPQEYLLEKNNEIVFSPAQKRLRVTPLSRMGRHRTAISKLRKRLPALKGWKPRSLERRAALRDQALKRKVIRRQLKSSSVPAGKAARSSKARAAARAKAKARANAARQRAAKEMREEE